MLTDLTKSVWLNKIRCIIYLSLLGLTTCNLESHVLKVEEKCLQRASLHNETHLTE